DSHAMRYILSIDQGTTSCRAFVFDESGKAVASAQREFAQHYPQPGWVEHSATEIFQTQYQVCCDALARAAVPSEQIAALGITNQRETVVVWDRATGEPITNAIVWQCRRTAPLCEEWKQRGWEEDIRARTGLLLDPYFSGTKLRWILDNVPGARRAAERGELAAGTIDSWLLWKLTGGAVHATDVSNASRTMLLNLDRGEWDTELLRLFDIPQALLPRVLPSATCYGETQEAWFGRRLPILALVGDQQAALFGQACWRPGMVKSTYGTGSFVLLHTGEKPLRGRGRLLSTVAWKRGENPTEYALEGSVFVAGAALQWLRDGLGVLESADQSEALASSVADSGGIYFVPAFVGLGAPHWDPSARGLIVGVTRGTRREHLVRAALEAVAFQTQDLLTEMTADSPVQVRELRVDGGMAANNFLLQFQADCLGLPVIRPCQTETTALGAAFLAGLEAGVWRGLDEIEQLWSPDRVFEPAQNRAYAETAYAGWKKAVQLARSWSSQAC
ncbi:MAG TPA: glycerol kinase GlpK, partial [Candidatus Acidoferrales bacterium]|nr:glycerol kinase GlpK [Candidatus Acidoferrales bacterium]